MYNGHQLIKISTQQCWCWSGWWFLQPSVKLLRPESPPTIYDQICKQCGCEFDDHLPILMFFSKVRSPSSGSLQKLQSGNNRCPELRSLTWKETKHVHYYFHRNLRGDRIGNQNTLKVSFYLPPESKQSLLHIRSLELPKIFIDGSFWGAWAKSYPSSLLTLAVASEVICNWYYFKFVDIQRII